MGFLKALFLCYITLTNLLSLTIAQPNFLYKFCNYNTTSTVYHTNRDTLLSSLANKTDQYGFYTSSFGENPDTVYALVLCRADTKLDACRECISNSVTKLTQLCPDEKEAIGWYDDCMLRYSNTSMKGVMAGEPTIYVWNDEKNVTSVEKVKDVLEDLLDDLGAKAAASGTRRKFASGNAKGPDSQTLYAFTQCTPDLSEQDCSDCMKGAIEGIPKCCDGPAGGRVIRPSCNFRFELQPFVGEISGSEAPTPSPAGLPRPQPPPPTGGGSGLKSSRGVSVAAASGSLIGLALVLV